MRPRIALEVSLSPQIPVGSWQARHVRDEDAEDLATLLYAAFRGTVDDEGETFADAMAEVENLLAGAYGRFLPDCSFVVEDGEFLVSASLVSWFEQHEAPLLAFTMTRPEAQRRGLARFLLQHSINALQSAGFARLTLIVTEANTTARRLYESLGFRSMV